MAARPIQILDFDGSVTKQAALIERYRPRVIDLSDLGPAARFWMDGRTRRKLEERLAGTPKDAITFLGSGDFHHVSNLLIERLAYEEPLSIISFDAHPDWDTALPVLSCGSWVARLLRDPAVEKVILLGATFCGRSPFSLFTGALSGLTDDRVEIYPYFCHPMTVPFRRVPENISFETVRKPLATTIRWNDLASKNLIEFFLHIIRRLPSRRVYVTIDKDCLHSGEALTNWNEGGMSLDELIMMVKEIKDNCDIAGLDITGDYSPVRMRGIVKNFAARANRPKEIKALSHTEAEISKVNEAANLRILELVHG